MKKSQLRPLWLRKRVFLPLCLILGLIGATVIALLRSDVSSIVIYNETGGILPPLLVRACSQTKAYPALQDQESVRFKLEPRGPTGTVHMEMATDPPWSWDSENPIPSHGGYRLTIRIEPGNQVEAFTDISWWRGTFFNINAPR